MRGRSGIVCEHGINDMHRGWTIENKYNEMIYRKWHDMLRRVYSEKFHDRQQTYIDCTLCLEWHWLSKFAEDIVKIDGYNYEKFINGELDLDKDIKSNGNNKEYSVENCMFVSSFDNTKQSTYNRDNNYLKNNKHRLGKNHTKETKQSISEKQKIKIVQYDLNGNLIKVWNGIIDVEEELGINNGNISECCRGKRKSAGGFIWKYYEK